MKTLRNYAQLIQQEVKKINDADPNWKWRVKKIEDWRVSINWGYLDYCQEKNNCFFVALGAPDSEGEYFLTARTPDDKMIDGYFVAEDVAPDSYLTLSFENAIKYAIEAIAEYAHIYY